MNPWNYLEKELRSWTPRNPSPSVKARLFGEAEVAEPQSRLTLNWLAPAAACMLLLFVTFGPRSEAFPGAGQEVPGSMVAMSLSNASVAAFLPSSPLVELNRVARSTFQSTSAPRSLSSLPFRPAPMTNQTDW